MEDVSLSWPYGFRFEWKLKRVYRQSEGPNNDSEEPSLKVKPPIPSDSHILQNIPDNIGDQLQSTVLSLNKFQESLGLMQISSETKRIVLQRVLTDMAGNERDALLAASVWWRQGALEYGSGYVDAIVSHYLYKSLKSDMSAEWERSREETGLKWEAEEMKKRRQAMLATTDDHVFNLTEDADDNSAAIEVYLARAEVIRDLIIYTNKKICTTTASTEGGQDKSVDTLIGAVQTDFNDNDDWRLAQLEKSKRVASVVQLNDLCEQNNWSLVVCHVETEDLCGRPKLFRRLLSVVSKQEDDPTRARAVVRPAIQPFPMLALDEYNSSEGGRSDLSWDRCSDQNYDPAERFYPLNAEFVELQQRFGRREHGSLVRPNGMSKVFQRKVDLFDFFDDQGNRIVNPFTHFRHMVDDLLQIKLADGRPFAGDTHAGVHLRTRTPSNSPAVRSASLSSRQGLATPRKLLVHPYNTPTHTPSSLRSSFSFGSEQALTPTRSKSTTEAVYDAQIELLRTDLAMLFRALLMARGIDTTEGNEAIAAKLNATDTFGKITMGRLLANPIFQERYGALGEAVENFMPSTSAESQHHIDLVHDDTAAVFWEVLASRGIDLAAPSSKIVEQLRSRLMPEEMVHRVLINPRVKARRRRKRKADEAAAQEIKEEMKADQTRRDRARKRCD